MKKLCYIGKDNYELRDLAFKSTGDEIVIKSESFSRKTILQRAQVATAQVITWTEKDMEVFRTAKIAEAQLQKTIFETLDSLNDEIKEVYVDENGTIVEKPVVGIVNS